MCTLTLHDCDVLTRSGIVSADGVKTFYANVCNGCSEFTAFEFARMVEMGGLPVHSHARAELERTPNPFRSQA